MQATDSSGNQRMTSKTLTTVMVMVICGILCGCGPAWAPRGNLKRGDLIGTYRVTYNQYYGMYLGKETLVLKPDSTFEQTFIEPHGKTRHNNGTWKWAPDPSEGYSLELDGLAKNLNDEYDKVAVKPIKTNISDAPRSHGRHIWITIDEDLGIYYEKK